MESRHLEMSEISISSQETFKVPWNVIIYSTVMWQYPNWEQMLMEKCVLRWGGGKSSQGHKQPTYNTLTHPTLD